MIFNLLGKTILENSIGALKHHIKKKEVARNTEIECQKEIQIEKIKQSGGSFKDELIFNLKFSTLPKFSLSTTPISL